MSNFPLAFNTRETILNSGEKAAHVKNKLAWRKCHLWYIAAHRPAHRVVRNYIKGGPMSAREKMTSALLGVILIASSISCRLFLPQVSAEVPPTLATTQTEAPVSRNTVTATTEPASKTPPPTPFDFGGMVSGQPISEWKGIPVMPGAIAGSEDNSGTYTFTIAAEPVEVADYYDREVTKLGFQSLTNANLTPLAEGMFGLYYRKGTEVCSVMIFAKEGVTLVMISK